MFLPMLVAIAIDGGDDNIGHPLAGVSGRNIGAFCDTHLGH